ncbi:NAC domain-containing protein 41-like [Arachis ipaensis]|uniref:NAC domain-containing protein 41-like n=1 Tax=Arachis ipaensis TaxID=130454 RepID=UPI0007AF03D6|nr:NAC domain-containing protein 41-like [Arachis ipaensis]
MASTKLPSGASKKFKPTDEELIQDFLLNKINGRPLPNNGTILEGEMFGTEKNPWEIWEENVENSYDGKDLYFFTTLKRKFSTNSLRMVRTIGLGSWEGEDIGKEIMANKTNQRIGMRKRYRFEKSDKLRNANDYAGKVEFVNQLENGDERMEIQNESPNQSDKANQSENNGDEKIDEIQRELTNQLENNEDEIQVEAFDTTIGIEANCEERKRERSPM